MPTYQYRCPACGHEFEEFQSMSEDPIGICPACGSKPERLISGGAGLIFKGTGFYITDYKKKGEKPAGDTKSETGNNSTKSDSKPESSPKPKTESAA